MTRWSLRRRLGKSKAAELEYRPVAAAPVTGRPSTQPTSAGQPGEQALVSQHGRGQHAAGQPGAGQPPPGSWFDPVWGRAAPPSPGDPGGAYQGNQHQPGQYPAGQLQPSQYAGSQYPGAGVAVLAPLPPAAAPAVAPPGPPALGLPETGQPGAAQPGLAQPGSLPPGIGPSPDAASPADAAAPSWDPRADAGLADAGPRAGVPWPDICDQFGLHLLVLAEQLRTSLDELESDEGDPERLRRLYQVDHAVTRMRRASRDLRTLAGRSEEELAGFTTSLLDVIRMAASAIERYTQVTIGRVSDLAVLGYAADDVGALMAALLDNATRYSPGMVSVSGHLLGDGSMMFRIEDTGIGLSADQVAALNTTLAGPVPDVDERTGRHTGFPVVHRIARKHSVGVRLAARPQPSSGTVAMVTLPPHLLCEVPEEEVQRRPGPAAPSGQALPPPQAVRPAAVPDLPRGEPTRPHQPLTHQPPTQPPATQPPQPWEPPELPDRDQPRLAGELPRRERASLRGDDLRSQPREQPPAPSPEQQSAARRAFAEELSAFTQGAALDEDGPDPASRGQASRGQASPGQASPGQASTAAPLVTEEEAKP
jgi:Histidine kinase-, DNA gyrase B-, and HSP90-like ATPase